MSKYVPENLLPNNEYITRNEYGLDTYIHGYIRRYYSHNARFLPQADSCTCVPIQPSKYYVNVLEAQLTIITHTHTYLLQYIILCTLAQVKAARDLERDHTSIITPVHYKAVSRYVQPG